MITTGKNYNRLVQSWSLVAGSRANQDRLSIQKELNQNFKIRANIFPSRNWNIYIVSGI